MNVLLFLLRRIFIPDETEIGESTGLKFNQTANSQYISAIV